MPKLYFTDTGLACYWQKISKQTPDKSYVIYGGDSSHQREFGQLLSWKKLTDWVF